ncbi:MAG: class I SAM-dependent methyltransferase [Candidatus Aminicenantes bacterium]|nr:class I SAM-dependent methyltransferase [Candidatus Aminicenantes bacterium]
MTGLKIGIFFLILAALFLTAVAYHQGRGNSQSEETALDRKVRQFLDSHRYSWRDMNVSEGDGRILYDLIIKHGYRRALEIGTSTGHSAIWIAWALSKTGGKLITIEIDEGRYLQALANFKSAGLEKFIEARLGEAHQLVPALPGPFDFVFCDADKDWYKNYLEAVLPKLEPGGCFAAHNVGQGRGSRWLQRGIREFLDYAYSRPELETVIETSSRAGISLSFKKK